MHLDTSMIKFIYQRLLLCIISCIRFGIYPGHVSLFVTTHHSSVRGVWRQRYLACDQFDSQKFLLGLRFYIQDGVWAPVRPSMNLQKWIFPALFLFVISIAIVADASA